MNIPEYQFISFTGGGSLSQKFGNISDMIYSIWNNFLNFFKIYEKISLQTPSRLAFLNEKLPNIISGKNYFKWSK